MKHVKMLGVATVAVMAQMAFVGSSTASATVLCRTRPTFAGTCPANQAYPGLTEFHAVSETKPVLTTFVNVECEGMTINAITSNEGSGGETVTSNISDLKFIEPCNCEVKVLKKGSLVTHWIENTGDGTLTSSGTELTIECNTIFGKVHCIYGTNATHLGTLTGGEEATMDIESANIPRLVTSSLCAEKANLDVKFKITTPKPFWVAKET